MRTVVYFLVTLAATTAGGMTGMGGGVIIKPVLDVMHDFDAVNIGILSSGPVFAMALFSMIHHLRNRTAMDRGLLVPLIPGSLVGGVAGEWLLTRLAAGMDDALVLIWQNMLLALMVAGIFVYMLYKDRITPRRLHGIAAASTAGLVIGVISSFLGIGGGPINVALLIYLFGMDTKSATVASLLTILFSQGAKLVSVALSGHGFTGFDLRLMPYMVVAGIVGGTLGARLNKTLPDRVVDMCFNGMQVVVFAICLYNIANLA